MTPLTNLTGISLGLAKTFESYRGTRLCYRQTDIQILATTVVYKKTSAPLRSKIIMLFISYWNKGAQRVKMRSVYPFLVFASSRETGTSIFIWSLKFLPVIIPRLVHFN